MTWLMACGLAAMVVLFVIALLGMIHLARRDKETDDRRTAEQFGPTFDRWGMPRPQVRRRARHRATAYTRMVRRLRSALRRLEPVAVETVPTPAVQPPAPTVPVGPPPPWPGVDSDVPAGEVRGWRTPGVARVFTRPTWEEIDQQRRDLEAWHRDPDRTTLLPPVMSEQGGAR